MCKDVQVINYVIPWNYVIGLISKTVGNVQMFISLHGFAYYCYAGGTSSKITYLSHIDNV